MSVLTLTYAEYAAFASFTFGGTTYYLGTLDELRGGNWYAGILKTSPELEMAFGDPASLTQAQNVDLIIGDPAGGTYRTLIDGNILDGAQVLVTLVVRQHWNDGSTTETTYAQILTIVGTALSADLVTLKLQDLEDQKLAALYPLNTLSANDWTDLTSDDAGKPICEPVGTAIKLPCALVRSDTLNNEYWYLSCTGTPKTIGVSAVNSGTKTITLASAPTIALTAGQVIVVTGSTAADGRYTVAAAAGTSVTVNETLPASTGGSVRLMPVPLTVYRNKRIVSAGEYTVQQGYSPSSGVTNGNFASGSTGWSTSTAGAGAGAVFTAGNCAITCVNNTNYAYVAQFAAGKLGPGAFYAIQVTLGAGADGVIGKDGPPQATGRRLPANATTTVFITSNVTGADGFAISCWNYSGTCNVTNVRIIPLNLTLIKFTTPQVDFNGTPYTIEADVLGVESRDACAEIQRLLGLAGVTADATTFNTAIAQTFAKLVDCDYGRSGQRKFDAILADLLVVARGGLSRSSVGAYTIWQDVSGAATVTLDETLADAVQVDNIASDGRPASVAISCAPSSADASTMQVPLSRTVTGGVLGAQSPREIRYLRDGTTMDQLVCYLALRAQYCRRGTATIYRQQVNIGDKVTITSAKWIGARTFIVWGVQRVKSGCKCTLMEYNAAVYTYTAGTLPSIATAGYQPDYSSTPPAAPTGLKITATGTSTDGTTTTAYANVTATPPSVNWQTLWFAAIHNTAGTITAVPATYTAGVYKATIPGLRPGEVYKLQCYATAGTLQGAIDSTFDATAIGGSAAATTFTTAGAAAVPATVASCTATQSMGSYIQVSWPAIAATANLQGYALERKIGSGAFTQIWQGNALNFQDANLTYSTAYQYRVRALDIYGNFSAAYATSGSVTPTGNITGGTAGDIGSTTVATANRTNTTTVTSSWTNNGTTRVGVQSLSMTHSLGRVPVLGAVASGVSGCGAGATSVSTTSISLAIDTLTGLNWQFSTATGALINPGSFASMTLANASGTASVDVW
ncbi:MAG TPA: hypothetical protein VFB54_03550 [Burkholderiales bacterium]|nr:hypothetical protein [Burkholderiales bacterium]